MTGSLAMPAFGGAEGRAPTLQWLGMSKVLGPPFLRMPVLTIGMLGLQMVWSVEMSYASPYLLSLGMSKSLMSIVFLAGPLSGLIVQPLIGALSDGSHSRFGRRRPYILLGACVSFGAMYVLGFTREFASLVTSKGSAANNTLTISLAVLSIYCIDFSINAVQAMDRALLVDILPVSEQEKGNAWAGRMFGLGSVFGFFVGNVDLTTSLPFLGRTQLEILCVTTSCILILTHVVTTISVKERVLLKAPDRVGVGFSPWRIITSIWQIFFTLPSTIKRICLIQLFAWIGWFPVLFWTSLYVGELHKRNSPIPSTDAAKDALNAEATRFGTRAMLCNALASLLASVFCPFFVTNANGNEDERRHRNDGGYKNDWVAQLKMFWERRPTCHLATMWAVSHGSFSVCMLSTFFISDVLAATVVMTLTGFSWALTQWAPFALIAEIIHSTSFENSSQYVLASVEDDSEDESTVVPLRDTHTNRSSDEMPLGDREENQRLIYQAKRGEFEDTGDGEIDHGEVVGFDGVHHEVSESEASANKDDASSPAPIGLNHIPQSHIHDESGGHQREYLRVDDATGDDETGVVIARPREDENSLEDKAGIILGIHNVFIVIPQFIITGLSSIIFAIMDPGKSPTPHGAPNDLPPSPTYSTAARSNQPPSRSTLFSRTPGEAQDADSIGVIFRIGGVSAAVACVLCLELTRRFKRS